MEVNYKIYCRKCGISRKNIPRNFAIIIKLKIVNKKKKEIKILEGKLIIKFIVEIIVEKKMPRNFAIIIKLKIVGKKKN